MSGYDAFLAEKAQLGAMGGFDPLFMPAFLFDFQSALVEWAIRKGRSAIFADCGLGKTPMQLVWAENIVRRTNGRVLILAPLAVSYQIVDEAEKFGIDVTRCIDGNVSASRSGIVVTNYERADRFNSSDFQAIVCDESSILKNFDGSRRAVVTELMRTVPYRLLCTATAAPNDYVELGTSSEALGELGHMDMLSRFFRNVDNTASHRVMRRNGRQDTDIQGEGARVWRFKGHAETHFWRWVCSWARAVRKPSDLGFEDNNFILPPLVENIHTVKARSKRSDTLFDFEAQGLDEQRQERRRTVAERCEKVADLVADKNQSLIWCHLNDEGDLLRRLVPEAEQVKGGDTDDAKEGRLRDFARGDLRRLITKPKIGAWGLNFQRCAHVTAFPSHSYEQYYQGVRRVWRFGQKRDVCVDIVSTEGERQVMKNMRRKAASADRMFANLVAEMQHGMSVCRSDCAHPAMEVPQWLT